MPFSIERRKDCDVAVFRKREAAAVSTTNNRADYFNRLAASDTLDVQESFAREYFQGVEVAAIQGKRLFIASRIGRD